jgi:hypothetical protein
MEAEATDSSSAPTCCSALASSSLRKRAKTIWTATVPDSVGHLVLVERNPVIRVLPTDNGNSTRSAATSASARSAPQVFRTGRDACRATAHQNKPREAGRLRLRLYLQHLSLSLSLSSSHWPSTWLKHGHLSLLLHIQMAERTFLTM